MDKRAGATLVALHEITRQRKAGRSDLEALADKLREAGQAFGARAADLERNLEAFAESMGAGFQSVEQSLAEKAGADHTHEQIEKRLADSARQAAALGDALAKIAGRLDSHKHDEIERALGEVRALLPGLAPAKHKHGEYVTRRHFNKTIEQKADAGHAHDEYARREMVDATARELREALGELREAVSQEPESVAEPSGPKFLFDEGKPASSLGENGDLYLDLKHIRFYHKRGGHWRLIWSDGGSGTASNFFSVFPGDPVPYPLAGLETTIKKEQHELTEIASVRVQDEAGEIVSVLWRVSPGGDVTFSGAIPLDGLTAYIG